MEFKTNQVNWTTVGASRLSVPSGCSSHPPPAGGWFRFVAALRRGSTGVFWVFFTIWMFQPLRSGNFFFKSLKRKSLSQSDQMFPVSFRSTHLLMQRSVFRAVKKTTYRASEGKLFQQAKKKKHFLVFVLFIKSEKKNFQFSCKLIC